MNPTELWHEKIYPCGNMAALRQVLEETKADTVWYTSPEWSVVMKVILLRYRQLRKDGVLRDESLEATITEELTRCRSLEEIASAEFYGG